MKLVLTILVIASLFFFNENAYATSEEESLNSYNHPILNDRKELDREFKKRSDFNNRNNPRLEIYPQDLAEHGFNTGRSLGYKTGKFFKRKACLFFNRQCSK